MMLKPLGIALVVVAGFVIGASRPTVNERVAALTVDAALILHTLMKLALPHVGIEDLAARAGGSLLVLIALLETVGLWLPVLLLRWSGVRTRAWVAAYLAGAALLAAAAYYFPFDVVLNNGERI